MLDLFNIWGKAGFNAAKHITGVLIDDGGNILDTIFDGVNDGKIIITNSKKVYDEVRDRILDSIDLWGE